MIALHASYADTNEDSAIRLRLAEAKRLFQQISKQPKAMRETSFRVLDELGFDLLKTNGHYAVRSSNRATALSALDRATRENGWFDETTNTAHAIWILHELHSVPRIVDGRWLDLRLRAGNGLATNETISAKIAQLNELQLRIDAPKEDETRPLSITPTMMVDTSAETFLAFSRMSIYLDSFGLVFDPDARIWMLVSDRKQHPSERPETVRLYERIVSQSIELD